MKSSQPARLTPAFSMQIVAECADIDLVGHVSNIAYVRWVQDVAVAHSAAVGLTWDDYVESGSLFVVHRHDIEYLRSAVEGDQLSLITYVTEIRGASCLRHTRIERTRDGSLLARAATRWAYVSRTTGRPGRIPASVVAAFMREPTGPLTTV